MHQLAWAPDGGSIAFFGTPLGNGDRALDYRLGIRPLAASDVDWVVRFPAYQERWAVGAAQLTFDTGGLNLVYVSPQSASDLWVVNLRSREGRLLASLPAGVADTRPIGWIDATRLAVHAFGGNPNYGVHAESQLLLIDITTGEVRPITGLLPPYTTVLSVERLPD